MSTLTHVYIDQKRVIIDFFAAKRIHCPLIWSIIIIDASIIFHFQFTNQTSACVQNADLSRASLTSLSIDSCQVLFIIVFKTFSLQYSHLSDIKCELKIMTLLEFMYIVMPNYIFKGGSRKGLKSGIKIIQDKTSRKKCVYCWMKTQNYLRLSQMKKTFRCTRKVTTVQSRIIMYMYVNDFDCVYNTAGCVCMAMTIFNNWPTFSIYT
jgi:hypothetical protein